MMTEAAKDRSYFLLLNIGHFLDHLFMLIFATVAALALSQDWGLSYAELLAYATPGFLAFGLFALPAGWLADKWSRDGMMVLFFVGIGVASILTSFAQTPFQIGLGLFAVGVLAAIYHPVGLAIVTMKWKNTGMRLAANGVWGNLGVASAALVTGYLIDNGGWRLAFIMPGVLSIIVGLLYLMLRRDGIWEDHRSKTSNTAAVPMTPEFKRLFIRVSGIVFLTTAVSSIVFQSTTFALPKMFEERLAGLGDNLARTFADGDVATVIGTLAFVVFAIASLAQLVVGASLDRFGPRRVFMAVALMQIVFFAISPGLADGIALAAALGFMLGAFGQIPINDFMIGKMASGAARARVYGIRYVVSFTVLAATLPLIAFVHGNWGFDVLFYILAGAALVIFSAVAMLPKTLPTQNAHPS